MATALRQFGAVAALISLLFVISDDGRFKATPVEAAAFTVTKIADTADGTCDADCSLREAIIAANAAAGPHTISLPAGLYLLNLGAAGEDAALTGDLDIIREITITGAAAATTIINGNANDRVFDVLTNGNLSLTNITVTNGGAVGIGGGILVGNSGELTMTDSVVSSNRVNAGGGGAGINSSNAVTLVRTTVTGNGADDTGSGGGILTQGGGNTLELTDSTVSLNLASFGAGIYNSFSDVTLDNSFITLNTSGVSGGGIYSVGGTVALTNNTRITANVATAGDGGGISFDGDDNDPLYELTIEDSTITGNSAFGRGGGVYNLNGHVEVTTSTIGGTGTDEGNSAQNGGGIGTEVPGGAGATLIITGSSIMGNFASEDGGGIYALNDPTTVIASTISSNEADDEGGGVYNSGATLTMVNSTLSGNTAPRGAAISNHESIPSTFTDLLNVTVAFNVVEDDSSAALYAVSEVCDLGCTRESEIRFRNTLILATSGGPNCLAEPPAVLTSLGNNLDDDESCTTNDTGATVIESTLEDNGGPTLTHALVTNSLAIDAGDTTFCDTAAAGESGIYDQRGNPFVRIFDGDGDLTADCDIGAYEAQDTVENPCEPVPGPNETRTGCVIIRKVVTGGGDDNFNFEISGDGPEDEFVLGDGDEIAFPIPAGLQPPAQIVIEEEVPTGWTVGIFCVNLGFTRDGSTAPNIATLNLQDGVPSASSYIDCTVTNTPPPPDCDPVPSSTADRAGCVIVRKVVSTGANPQSFDFTITSNDPLLSFDLSHLQETAYPLSLTGGTVTIDEDIPVGWTLSISCSESGFEASVPNNATGTATFTRDDEPPPAGRWIDCTYTNTPPDEPEGCNTDVGVGVAAEPIDRCLIVEKQTSPLSIPQNFAFQASGNIQTENFSLADDDTHGIPLDLAVGDTITISETLPLGWFTLSIDCSANAGFTVAPNGPGSVILTAVPLGQAPARYAVCVFTNIPLVGGGGGSRSTATPTATATPTRTATATQTATPTVTVTPTPIDPGRPNLGGIFAPLLTGPTTVPTRVAATTAPVTIRPPSTGDGGLQ